jgi:hypothetical protein
VRVGGEDRTCWTYDGSVAKVKGGKDGLEAEDRAGVKNERCLEPGQNMYFGILGWLYSNMLFHRLHHKQTNDLTAQHVSI